MRSCQLTFRVIFNQQGVVTTIHVTVPYTGIMDTTIETFTECRAEIRSFLFPFTNWPDKTDKLIPQITGCPALVTSDPYKFVLASDVCPSS